MRTESPYEHGTARQTAVVLVNLGTPAAPTAAALKPYLKQFLSDPRVVEIPRLIWSLILNGIILQIRPARSAKKYATVWMPEGSPLRVHTERQATRLQQMLTAAGHRVTVVYAMRYGQPSLASVLDPLLASGHDKILLLPLYPQYAAATVATVLDDFAHWARDVRNVPALRFVKHFHDDPGYIQAMADHIQAYWAEHGRPQFEQGERLLLSFHGVPARTLERGDPYHCECYKTARLLRDALGLSGDQLQVSFQSRFGRAKWLEPYTDKRLAELAKQGAKRVDVFCPGFVSDCLETLEEIAMEGKETFFHAGGQRFDYIPCLNESPAWLMALKNLVIRELSGWPTTDDLLALEKQQAAPTSDVTRLKQQFGG